MPYLFYDYYYLILVVPAIIISLIAAILGLRNKDLEWEEFD